MLFAHNKVPWSLILPSKPTTAQGKEKISSKALLQGGLNTFPNTLDSELAAVWAALSECCTRLNAAAANGGVKVTQEAYLHSMGAIMYRLLHQRFATGSLDEAFRLGLLAFSSPIFLNWNRAELTDPRFNLAYRKALAGLDTLESHHVASREYIWLLIVAALSMSHEADSMSWLISQLRMNVELCDVHTWDEMQKLLSSILWLDVVYNAPCKDIFSLILI